MPIDTTLASKTWIRYAWCRDNGHQRYIEKADRCDAFFRGEQWDTEDLQALKQARRPAMTINKILSTVGNVMGEQIRNRNEISFRPKSGSRPETADALTKVFKHISDENRLDWLRSEMFADGIITGRGFLDIRTDHSDNVAGEVRITQLNPKNVIVDPDAEQYDPETWADVITTKWMTADDIAILYNEDDAEELRGRTDSYFAYGYDSIQAFRDRVGDRFNPMYSSGIDESSVLRNLRVIERQHRMLDKQKHFLSEDGDTRPIPDTFDRDRIAYFVDNFGLKVISKLVRRIRWTVICDSYRLHDDWSPYDYFTVVPYFPYFRHGKTIGVVENLLGPQEILNKVSSQELHIVNTTANSGYKVKSGALANMSVEELELKGAQTGIVIEVNGDINDIEKIQPNQVPTGLDRVSYKAEESIKTISGVSDSMQGFDREDVAAKAIQAKRQAGSTNMVKPFDNLQRSDTILAEVALHMVQRFYTEERLLTITKDSVTGETEELAVNQATAEGEIINDLTLGEYGVVVSSVPVRETLEDSEFEQAVSLRELGIQIPDSVLIENSRLRRKAEVLKLMQGDQDSPEAQAARQLEMRAKNAEVSKAEGEAAAKHADASLKQAKTEETMVKAQVLANTPPESPQQPDADPYLERDKAEHEADLKEREFERDTQLKFMEHGLRREEMNQRAQERQIDRQLKRDQGIADNARMAANAAQRHQGESK